MVVCNYFELISVFFSKTNNNNTNQLYDLI